MRDAPVMYAPAPVATPEALSPGAEETARKSLALGTLALYRGIAGKLDQWLQARGWEACDTTIAEYLAHEHARHIAPGTISLIPAAVRYSSKMSGRPDPVGPHCKRVLAGIKREGAGRGNGQAKGLSWSEAERVAACALVGEPGPRDYRDAAMILLMSDALLRVGEAVAVRVDDIDTEDDGSGRLTLRRSKTDQEGKGAVLYVGPPTMAMLRDWLEIGGVDSGPAFRRVRRGGNVQDAALTSTAARGIIQARAREAGITGRVSGHSARVGAAQSLAAAGAGLVEMQAAGRWASPSMPAHYAKGQLASRGAVAKLRYSRG